MRIAVTAVTALLGFAAGFVITWIAGVDATMRPSCDGPCFNEWDELALIAVGIGLAVAVVLGFTAWFVVTRRAPRRRAPS